jgi:hypothetical protein
MDILEACTRALEQIMMIASICQKFISPFSVLFVIKYSLILSLNKKFDKVRIFGQKVKNSGKTYLQL